MTDRQRLARQLQKIRRELDQAAEQVDRLARALAEHDDATLALVGQAEIAELAGVRPGSVGVMAARGQLPAPVAELRMGRVWLRSDIDLWLAGRKS